MNHVTRMGSDLHALVSDGAALTLALEGADIAPLLMVLVHLSGEEHWLDEVAPYINGPWNFQESVPEELKARVRARTGEVLRAFAESGRPLPSEPPPGLLRKMLSSGVGGAVPEDVTYVVAHGTSTPLGDKAETAAVKRVFGEHARKLAISSTKSQLGHTLGASGGIELVVCALTLARGVISPTINLENPDPDCDLDYTPNVPRQARVAVAMSNSFGFGGHNASLLLGRV